MPDSTTSTGGFDPLTITRPDKALMWYYLVVSLLTGPGVFVAILPLFFKYETLRYRFDGEGVSMSWGILSGFGKITGDPAIRRGCGL